MLVLLLERAARTCAGAQRTGAGEVGASFPCSARASRRQARVCCAERVCSILVCGVFDALLSLSTLGRTTLPHILEKEAAQCLSCVHC